MKKLKEKFDSEELFMYEGYVETKKACESLGLVFEEIISKDFVQIYEPDDPLDRVVFCDKKHVFLVSEVFWEVMDREVVEQLFEEEEL